MKKRIPITVVFHLEMTFDDSDDAEFIRFHVEENHCLDNHIDKLAECSNSREGVCFGCEVGEAYVGHLPFDALRTIAERDEGEDETNASLSAPASPGPRPANAGTLVVDRAVQSIARARGLAYQDEPEPYRCECGSPVTEIRWAESALGPGIETVRGDKTVCCVSQIGEYPTAASARGRLEVLRHYARGARVREES